ncbi:MAG: hypothetical protein AB7U73_04615 [Pirellulales bacterium]
MNSCPAEHELAALANGERASDEVEAHVRSCAACQQHLSDVKTALTHLRNAVSRSRAPTPAAPGLSMHVRPSFVGKYFIAGTLAEYPDRAVYRGAHHLIDQQVVLTLASRPWPADAATRATVAAECRRLLGLKHPNVAKVLDYDLVDDRPYTVEEFVRGPGLDQVIASRRVAWQDAAGWIAQLAEGAAAARAAELDMPPIDARHARLSDQNVPQLVGIAEAWLERRVLLLIPAAENRTSGEVSPPPNAPPKAADDDVRQLAALFKQLLHIDGASTATAAANSTSPLASEVERDARALETAGVPQRRAMALARVIAPTSAGGASTAAELAEQFRHITEGRSWLAKLFG